MIAVDALLAPVPGEAPEGADLRNPVRHERLIALRDAWRNARRAEQQTDGAAQDARAAWDSVERGAEAILTSHSKDLEAAAMLCEALVRTEGFAGLALGAAVVAGLVRASWPALYPRPEPDEDDRSPEEVRLDALAQVAGPDGRLLPAIRQVELFALPDGTAFTLFDCQQSKAWTALRPEQRAQRLASLTPQHRAERETSAGTQLWDQVTQTVRAASAPELAALRQDVAAALAGWKDVATALDTAAGDGAFAAGPLTALLEEVLKTVSEIAPPQAVEEAPPPPVAETPSAVANGPPSPVVVPPPLASRDDGLRQLAELAAFFRRTEPYSPLSYTLDEAMRRARLTWPELLTELVPDRAQRDTILLRLGIRPDAPTG